MHTARLAVLAAVLVVVGAAAAAAEIRLPSRIATATVGEWASYRLPDGYIQKQTVIERDGTGPEAVVTVRIENIFDGEVIETKEISREAGEPEYVHQLSGDPAVTVDVSTREEVVHGQTLTATIIDVNKEYDDDDDLENEVSEWVLSAEIPVFGMIRKVTNGQTEFELIEYGE
ncbi:MAG: hypothetical protein LIP77_08645 [Planctomycetes bacterium]|nr:hypothetical protein [Planctomycetota bacterium]